MHVDGITAWFAGLVLVSTGLLYGLWPATAYSLDEYLRQLMERVLGIRWPRGSGNLAGLTQFGLYRFSGLLFLIAGIVFIASAR